MRNAIGWLRLRNARVAACLTAAMTTDQPGVPRSEPLAATTAGSHPTATTHPSDEQERRPRARQRTMRAVSWSREWSVGGDPNDTTFFAIISLAATRDHIVVVDGGRRRLVALAQASGRVQWRAGSPGSGPGELGHGVQVSTLASGGFLMVDGSKRWSRSTPRGRTRARGHSRGRARMPSRCSLDRPGCLVIPLPGAACTP